MRFPIRFFSDTPTINFMAISAPVIVITIALMIGSVYLLATKGLNFGIDFAGGVVMEIKTEKPADLAKMRALLANSDIGNASLQKIDGDHQVMIRVKPTKDASQSHVAGQVKTLLSEHYLDHITYEKVDYVGPQVGEEMIEASTLALILGLLAIMGYLWVRFEWQFGLGGILAMFHDALLTLGFYAITGLEFNLTSIAALLTIIGYSINDSVVIYDRIRENMRKFKTLAMRDLINRSINETLARTILTSGTLLLALAGLIFYGGAALFGFSVAMFFGAVIGTYSSIFISAVLLNKLNPRAVSVESD